MGLLSSKEPAHTQERADNCETPDLLPWAFDVDGDIAHEVIQHVDLSRVGATPSGVVKLVECCHVCGASNIEALGVVVDRVRALQPEGGILLAGESASVLAAEHVLNEEAARWPAQKVVCMCNAGLSFTFTL